MKIAIHVQKTVDDRIYTHIRLYFITDNLSCKQIVDMLNNDTLYDKCDCITLCPDGASELTGYDDFDDDDKFIFDIVPSTGRRKTAFAKIVAIDFCSHGFDAAVYKPTRHKDTQYIADAELYRSLKGMHIIDSLFITDTKTRDFVRGIQDELNIGKTDPVVFDMIDAK